MIQSPDKKKLYVTPQEVFTFAFQLADKVLDDKNFLLDENGKLFIRFGGNEKPVVQLFLDALWRGGALFGIIMQEVLSYAGIPSDHIASRTSRYQDDTEHTPKEKIAVHSMSYIVKKINTEDKLIIVDDTYDSGLSIEEVRKTLRDRCRKNTPHDIRTAVIFYKPDNIAPEIKPPTYYLHIVPGDTWIVYPWEIKDMPLEMIEEVLGREVYEICKKNKDRYTQMLAR